MPSTVHLSGIILTKYNDRSHNIICYKIVKLGDYLWKRNEYAKGHIRLQLNKIQNNTLFSQQIKKK